MSKPQKAQAPVFDTLKYANKLKKVGFTEEQAEVQAETILYIINDELASKENLEATKMDLRQDMKEMEAGIRHDMKEMEVGIRHDMKEMEVAIRHDMKEMEVGIRDDMKEMEGRLTSEISEVRHEMSHVAKDLKLWIGGSALTGAAAIVTVVHFFHMG